MSNHVDVLADQYDHALRVRAVSKSYKIWSDSSARVKVPLLRFAARKIPALGHIVDARVQGLCREFKALNNISFDLPRGTSMAIIGRNGSGKSTLLQVIAGTLKPTNGLVERSGRIAALLELGSGFNPEFTGRENVYMNGAIYGLDADQISARMYEVEEFAEIGVHIDQPVKTYSSGMMMRLAFSVQVLMDPEILIVDEALSVGDIFFQQKCFERMRRLSDAGTSILFVSHDLVTVAQFTQSALVLHDGEAVFLGDSGVAVKEYQIMERSSSSLSTSREIGSAETPLSQLSNSYPPLGVESAQATENLSHSIIKPSPLATIDLNGVIQIGSENAEFTHLSIFDSSGNPSFLFAQGSRLYVRCAILCKTHFNCLSVGVSIKDRTNVFVHGKHSVQHGIKPASLNAGDSIAFQFSFALELAPGHYSLDIGIIDIDSTIDCGIPAELIEGSIRRVCLNDRFTSFQICPRPQYDLLQLPFFGLTDLEGDCFLLS